MLEPPQTNAYFRDIINWTPSPLQTRDQTNAYICHPYYKSK